MDEIRAIKDPQKEKRLIQGRIIFLLIVVACLFAILFARYYHLQVTQHEQFATLADENRVHVRSVPPNRGLIFDRNGVLLAENKPSHTLMIIRERVNDMDALVTAIDQLLSLTGGEKERYQESLDQYRRPYEGVPLRFQLTEEELAILAANQHRLVGIEIETELIRHYPSAELLAHSVGYVGRINDREEALLDEVDYAGTHVIGKVGLEKQYEDLLHGEVGYEYVETDARGRVLRVLEREPPKSGVNLELYLDTRLQNKLHEALAGERAAAVMVEVKTGGVLAMVSTPSYDPNLFVTGISSSNYNGYLTDLDRPLFNRVVQGQYPPGSTVKPAYGVAALASNTITTAFEVFDPGFFRLPGNTHQYRDWKRTGHGNTDLRKAIQESCDTFFYDVGVRMGIETIGDYGTQMGIGVLTGIDLPSERQGVMPSNTWKYGTQGESWYPGDTVNTSIGQGFMLMTPLQMAQMTAIIARRGEVIPLQLVKKLGDEDQIPQIAAYMDVEESVWDYVFDAMQSVVHEPSGTANKIGVDVGYTIAGKTGTAQVVGIPQGEEYDAAELEKRQWDHALFVAFAPVENPQVAIGIIVENGEHGSSTAAPIARTIFDEYFSLQEQEGDVDEEPSSTGSLIANLLSEYD